MNNKFVSHLNIAIENSGLTAAEICKRTGLGSGTLANYRAGRYQPRQGKLYKLATVLQVSPAWLMGFSSEDDEPSLDRAILNLYSQLCDTQKDQALDYIRYLIASRKA